ncbi:hypothetical protein [Massilia genomosp. 1]|uniref:Transmembrane protein n=1 Tax=Massilia genomosp. 1 TaxID=2609280 RepID=A0ABX0MMU1_9BURK|nr:hypothetical protein [Massilia genomosp. 1]NHZ63402.1 hypothetical protein [Massilia genomosp. 1]
MHATNPTIDDCARQGRSVLTVMFAALLLVTALVLASTFGALGAWSERLDRSAPMVPLAIILFCAWVRHKQHHPGGNGARKSLWNALFQDEFRQQSIARAVRVGFVVVLLVQLPLAFTLGQQTTLHMACLSMLAGALAFLGAFLYLGRAEA